MAAAAAVGGAAAAATDPYVPDKKAMPRGSESGFVEVDPFMDESLLAQWAESRFEHTIPTKVPVKVVIPGEEPQFLYEPISERTKKPFKFPDGYIFLASAEPTRYFVGPSAYAIKFKESTRKSRHRHRHRRASRRRTSRRTSNRR